MDKKVIYLDNNATTMVAPEVIEAMLPFIKERWGNPSSIHRFGGTVRRDVEKARTQVAEFLGASPEEIYFTSCGTESDNIALKGFFALHKEKTRIITSNVEHPAILNTARYLQKNGAHLLELEVDPDGLLDPEIFKNLPIDEHTIVSIMWANNETGVIFPIEEIAPIVKGKGGVIHT
ncbi:MAG: aminotransferase class V-fold PLP-dependent enzyme, partial [Chitinispirillaceae bacterium]|nr:aminotransferase class V-fold PLP-dependent enzyme [Chitinispirillaceae bacterium]